MEAPPPKKQKKAPSVAGDVAAAVPASGWASLTTELIGTLSKFLDLPHENVPATGTANANGDMLNELMNLCLVSGPTTAKAIRHTYLRDTDAFLLHSMLSTHGLNRDVGKSEAALIKGRDNIISASGWR